MSARVYPPGAHRYKAHVVCEALFVTRQKLGLSLRTVCKLSGFSYTQMKAWEGGARQPGYREEIALRALLGKLQGLLAYQDEQRAHRRNRFELGYTQEQYAAHLGVHRVTVSRWERAEVKRDLAAFQELV